jgi:hypothetical protein
MKAVLVQTDVSLAAGANARYDRVVRTVAGIVGVVGAVALLASGVLACVGGALVLGLPHAPEQTAARTADVIVGGFVQVVAAAVALAFSVVLLAARLPRTASLILVLAGVLAIAFQGWLAVIVCAAGLLGLAARAPKTARPRDVAAV